MTSFDDLAVRLKLDTSEFLTGAEQAKRGLEALKANLSSMATGATQAISRGMNAGTRWEVTQISLQQSTERVRQSQDRYNAAVRDFGEFSAPATQALREMESAQQNLEKTQARAKIMSALIVSDLVGLATKAPAAIRQMAALAAAARAAAVGMGAFSVATTGGLAAVGLIVGIGAVTTAFNSMGDTVDVTGTKLDQLRLKQADLMEEWERTRRDMLRNVDTGKLFNFGGDMNPIIDPLKDIEDQLAQTGLEIERLRQTQRDAAVSFQRDQALKLAVVNRDEEAIRSQLQKSESALASYNALLKQPLELEEREILKHKFAEEEKMVGELTGVLGAFNNETQQLNANMTSGLTQGLAEMSVNFRQLGIDAQGAILAIAGVAPEFIAQMEAAKFAEDDLVRAALQSSEELRSQAMITKHKSETTAEFIVRLKELGFTEEEVAARINETGDAIKSQTAATEEAKQSAASNSSGEKRMSELGQLIESYKMDILKRLSPNMGQKGLDFMAARFDSEGIARVLRGQDDAKGISHVGVIAGNFGTAMRQNLIDTLGSLVTGELSPQMWDQLLRSMNVEGLAHGLDGIVRSPKLFLAGEHGPEHVSVRPVRNGGPGGEGGVHIGPITVYANDRRGGMEAADALARQLRRKGVFGVS